MTHKAGMILITLLVVAVLAAGCSNVQTPSSTPTAALTPTDTPAPAPTATPAPTAAPEPSPTASPRPSIDGVTLDRAEDQSTETAGQFGVSIWAPVAGFLEQQTMLDNADILDEVNFFWYTLARDGSIEGGIQASQAVKAARQAGLRIVPSIVNGGFDRQRVADVIHDPARRRQHVEDIVALVRDNGFDGIDIDYESLSPEDRDDFSLFIEELSAAMKAEGGISSPGGEALPESSP